MWNEPPIMT